MTKFEPVDILLVEDTVTDAEMTIRALRKCQLADNLTWVKDGQEALDFLHRTGDYAGLSHGKPRLILLDIKMPRVDGTEVLRQIRKDSTLRTVPVVMLTSSAEERDIVESYQLGANSFIVKPVDTTEFYRAITELGLYWMIVNKVSL